MKPGILIASLSSQNSEKICRDLHKQYENNRLPLSDYFRLSTAEANQLRLQLEEFGGKKYFQEIFTGYKLYITFAFFWILITFLLVHYGVDPIFTKFQ